jgi:hypothetical protein
MFHDTLGLLAASKTEIQKLIYVATMLWNNMFPGIVCYKSI